MTGPCRLALAALIVAAAAPPAALADEPYRPAVDRHGILDLTADRAILRGDRLRLAGDPPRIVDWASPSEEVRWDFELDAPGRFVVVVEYAAPAGRGGAVIEVVAADQVRRAPIHATGGPSRDLPQPLKGAIDLPAGRNRLEIRALEAPAGYVMDLRRVRLVPSNK